MDHIKMLIVAIQSVAAAGAMTRIVYLILVGLHEEDHTMRNKKIKNVFIALILIETALNVAAIIRRYYM